MWLEVWWEVSKQESKRDMKLTCTARGRSVDCSRPLTLHYPPGSHCTAAVPTHNHIQYVIHFMCRLSCFRCYSLQLVSKVSTIISRCSCADGNLLNCKHNTLIAHTLQMCFVCNRTYYLIIHTIGLMCK